MLAPPRRLPRRLITASVSQWRLSSGRWDTSNILFLFINGILKVRRFQMVQHFYIKSSEGDSIVDSDSHGARLPPPCRQSAVSGTAQRAAVLQGVWAGAPWWGDNTTQDIHILLTITNIHIWAKCCMLANQTERMSLFLLTSSSCPGHSSCIGSMKF